MPISVADSAGSPCIRLEGVVSAEEVDQFVALLAEHPGASLDLAACEHLHTAVLQLLLFFKPKLTTSPLDPFWSHCLCLNTPERKEIDENDPAG
jgi:hypothetical protein